jgi:hypothetical protein
MQEHEDNQEGSADALDEFLSNGGSQEICHYSFCFIPI